MKNKLQNQLKKKQKTEKMNEYNIKSNYQSEKLPGLLVGPSLTKPSWNGIIP